MNVAILGTGRVGGALGSRMAAAGCHVVYGSRAPDTKAAEMEASGSTLPVRSLAEAVESADVVIYAGPWPAAEDILRSVNGADGKILVDCTNPLNASFDGLDLGFDESAAERIAAWAPNARVVKAFNSVSSATMADPDFQGEAANMFICGDDAEAKETVKTLADKIGFDTIDAGPLRNARYLEPFAMLYIQLAMNGWGSNFAFKVIKR